MFNETDCTTLRTQKINDLESSILRQSSKLKAINENLDPEVFSEVHDLKNQLMSKLVSETDNCEDALLIKHLGNSLRFMNDNFKGY